MPDDVATARRILALAVSGCMLVALPPAPAVAAMAPAAEEGLGDPTAPPEPPAEQPGARAAIIPLVVEGELSASDRVQLTDELVEGLRRGAFDIVPPEKVATVAPEATTCEKAKCFKEIAAKNRATHIVRTKITVRDRDYDVRVELVDGRQGTLLASSQEGCEICGVADVGALIASAAATLRTKLDALAAGPSTLAVTTEPSQVIVSIDGNVVGETPLKDVTVVPGKRVIRVTKEGYIAIEREVTFVEGVHEQLSFTLEKVPSRLPGRTWGWVSLSIGLVGLGAGIAFTTLHDREYKLRGNCTGDNVDSQENCRFLYNTKWYGLAGTLAGAALVTLGIAILLNSPRMKKGKADKEPGKRKSKKKKARAGLEIGPGSISIRGRF
jgi:hypothetical protein